MHFLLLMENLDGCLNPRRKKTIWIAKFNFLGLLRVCDSFVHFRHVRNLYEGGSIGEGMVKELRPLVAKGVKDDWATNVLLSYYRQSSLELLIGSVEQTTGNSDIVEHCPLGPDVQESKFKQYTTAADVFYCNEGRYKYALLLNGWEYLDDKLGWSVV
jgi:hypothetical protein